MRTVNFIGGGNMARALIASLSVDGGLAGICVADPSRQAREQLCSFPGVKAVGRASDLPAADATVLAVKPFHLGNAAKNWDPKESLVISVVAGARISALSSLLGGYGRIIRTMPNTPALFGMGMTGIYAPPGISRKDRRATEAIFGTVGEILWVGEEALLDAVTALSGSGPAYVFRFFEALESAARRLGMESDEARRLVLQTMKGAIRMLERSGESADTLRKAVTSKNGTTEAALKVMEHGDLKGTIVRAAEAAKRRSEEIAAETEKN